MRGSLGGIEMGKLLEEYTDVKSVRHRVEHITLPQEDQIHKEKMMEALTHVLAKGTKMPA